MTRAAKIANRIERTVSGPMWHGPALADLLDGVPHERAAARPLPGAHSIWDIVRHITAWAEIVKRRLGGEILDPTPEEDWPPVSDDGQEAWARALERMAASHRELAAATRELQDAQLDSAVAGQEYPVSVMLNGVVEHGTYHGGQIALLKKA
ncbi:MAG TPA: DinB family protein [Vicinamibacterales bacterium]|nr:DinB family protein [Vicinamibacterales bacterium]